MRGRGLWGGQGTGRINSIKKGGVGGVGVTSGGYTKRVRYSERWDDGR